MIKEAIEKILSLAPIQTTDINGVTYTKGGVTPVLPVEAERPDVLEFNTLTGLVDFFKRNESESIDKDDVFIHVVDYDQVCIRGTLIPEFENKRFTYAKAIHRADHYRFGNFIDLEMFIISLQSMFVQDRTTGAIIDMLGKVANEHIQQNTDDGFSQTIQVRSGIARKSKVEVKNPVQLSPYRTFREVAQSASDCILRFNNTHGITVGLWVADGERWKLDAIQSIAAYLREQLPGVSVIA